MIKEKSFLPFLLLSKLADLCLIHIYIVFSCSVEQLFLTKKNRPLPETALSNSFYDQGSW